MFGRSSCTVPFQPLHKFDSTSYASYLKAKPHTLQSFVHAWLAKAAEQQKQQYDHFTTPRSFKIRDAVCLWMPTAGKLQPCLDGGWTVAKVKGPCNLKLTNSHHLKVVHVNHVRYWKQPGQTLNLSIPIQSQQCNSPSIVHCFVPSPEKDSLLQRCYPLCERHPPD